VFLKEQSPLGKQTENAAGVPKELFFRFGEAAFTNLIFESEHRYFLLVSRMMLRMRSIPQF